GIRSFHVTGVQTCALPIWALSEAVDYEAELGVLIGSPAKDVSEADALTHVWGYTVVNDITARNIQFSEAQWSRCKSFDGFTPTRSEERRAGKQCTARCAPT